MPYALFLFPRPTVAPHVPEVAGMSLLLIATSSTYYRPLRLVYHDSYLSDILGNMRPNRI